MSAIFGIFDKKNKGIPDAWKTGMGELLKHRNVDGKGKWECSNVFLGKYLMAISPESYRDKGPFELGNNVIVGDIDIYNRDEFIEKLEITDTGQTDSELVTLAYQKWQNNFVDYLVGDFALVIWDKTNQNLTCFVDHVGVRQFHYIDTEDYFVFSTEIKTFNAIDFVDFNLYDKKLEDDLLNFNYNKTTTADTYFESIKKLPAARQLTCNNTKSEVKIYWDPKPGKKYYHLSLEETATQLLELITLSVHQRMRTEHKIGVPLSGGLDSTTLACVAARKLAAEYKKLYSVSSVLPDNYTGDALDEKEFIDSVLIQEKNIVGDFVNLEETFSFDDLESAIKYSYEIPNLYYLMDKKINENMASKQVRVLLSGYFGDSITSINGYNTFVYLFKNLEWNTLFEISKQYSAIYKENLVSIFYNHVIKKIIKIRHKEFIKDLINGRLHLLYFSILKKNYFPFLKRIRIKLSFFNTFEAMKNSNSILWNIDEDWCATEMEINSVSKNVQINFPFSDKRIISFLQNINPKYFLANGWHRGLIRHSLKYIIPQKISMRRDKKPYIPDFFEKLSISKELMNDFENKNVEITNFVDITKPKKQLDSDNNYEYIKLIYIITFIKMFKRINFNK